MKISRSRSTVYIAGLFAVSIGLAVLLMMDSCCSGGRHREVTGKKFLELAQKPIGSALYTRFIGATDTRAYLSVWSALPASAGGGEDVYSVALVDLPEDIANRIRKGQNPWTR